ncbi:hypothetical protein OY671_011130, partial [Metschnikowia pulcherrima]
RRQRRRAGRAGRPERAGYGRCRRPATLPRDDRGHRKTGRGTHPLRSAQSQEQPCRTETCSAASRRQLHHRGRPLRAATQCRRRTQAARRRQRPDSPPGNDQGTGQFQRPERPLRARRPVCLRRQSGERQVRGPRHEPEMDWNRCRRPARRGRQAAGQGDARTRPRQ